MDNNPFILDPSGSHVRMASEDGLALPTTPALASSFSLGVEDSDDIHDVEHSISSEFENIAVDIRSGEKSSPDTISQVIETMAPLAYDTAGSMTATGSIEMIEPIPHDNYFDDNTKETLHVSSEQTTGDRQNLPPAKTRGVLLPPPIPQHLLKDQHTEASPAQEEPGSLPAKPTRTESNLPSPPELGIEPADPVAFDIFGTTSPALIVHLLAKQSIWLMRPLAGVLYSDSALVVEVFQRNDFFQQTSSVLTRLFSQKKPQQGALEYSMICYRSIDDPMELSASREIAIYSEFSQGEIVEVNDPDVQQEGLFVRPAAVLAATAPMTFANQTKNLGGMIFPAANFEKIMCPGQLFLQSSIGSIMQKRLSEGESIVLEGKSVSCLIAFSPSITVSYELSLNTASAPAMMSVERVGKTKLTGPGILLIATRPQSRDPFATAS